MVTLPEEHIDGEVDESVMLGTGFTITFTVPGVALTHPRELVPDTEYVVLIVGQITGPPFR